MKKLFLLTLALVLLCTWTIMAAQKPVSVISPKQTVKAQAPDASISISDRSKMRTEKEQPLERSYAPQVSTSFNYRSFEKPKPGSVILTEQFCDPAAFWGQHPFTPSESWAFNTSDLQLGPYKVYENFPPANICDIHYWGLSLFYNAGWTACSDPTEQFEIVFYNDVGGAPDIANPVYTYSPVVPTQTDTGENFAGIANETRYDFDFSTTPQGCAYMPNGGWVSIQAIGVTDPNCSFLWATSPDGDGSALQDQGAGPIQLGQNQAFCLTGDYIPTYGACCDDMTGTCTDGVEYMSCPAPLRFAANTLCANIDPPCEGCPDATITVEILTDSWPSETTWNVTDEFGNIVGSGGPYSGANTLYITNVCVAAGCYTFNIYDAWGDGIYAPGYYRVYYNGVVACENFNFSSSFESCQVGDCGPPPDYDGCEAFDNGLGGFNTYQVAGAAFAFNGSMGNPPGCAWHDDQTGWNDAWMISRGGYVVPSGSSLMFDQQTTYCAGYYILHEVMISTDYVDGNDPSTATWTQVYEGSQCENDGAWGGHSIDMSAYYGQAIHIGFHYQGDYATHWYVDNVCVGVPPTGACCVALDCVATNTQPECAALGGIWYQGYTCPDFACPEDPLGCPTGTVYSHPWGNPSSANTSDASFGYRVYDTIDGFSGDVQGIHFWGIKAYISGGWVPCAPDEEPMTFNVGFYPDAGGQPDRVNPTCTYSFAIPSFNTGELLWSYYAIYSWDAVIPTCTVANGWFSVQDAGGDANCNFAWINTGNTGNAYQEYPDGSMTALYAQFTYCLKGQYVPQYGACCDNFTGICTDNVEALDCPSPNSFYVNTLCANVTCEPAGCVDQQPNQSNGIFSDYDCDFCGGIQILSDNYNHPSDGTVDAITFWGGYYPGDIPSDPDQFTVVFRADDGTGLPGAALYTINEAGTKAQTGVVLFGVHEYVHTIDLTSYGINLTAGVYHVEVYNNTVGNTDSWFWEVGNLDLLVGIAGSSYTFTLPEEPWSYDPASDLSYVLTCTFGGGAPCGDYVVGDYNGSNVTNVADVVEMWSKLKTGNPTYPALLCQCPGTESWPVRGDVNNSCSMNVADVVWLFGKLKGLPNTLVPCEPCAPGAPAPRGGIKPLMVPDLKSKVKLNTNGGAN